MARRHITLLAVLGAIFTIGASAAHAQAPFTFSDRQAAARDQYEPPGGRGNPNPGGGNPGNGNPGNKPKDPRSGTGPDQAGGGGEPRGVLNDDASGDPRGLPFADANGGSLPFTGLDLSVLVLMGLLLTGAGCAIRIVQRRRAT